MHYMYVLKNKLNNECYFGTTSDLKKRLRQHNNSENISTKSGAPYWEVVYFEAYSTKRLALIRENRIKQYGQSWRRLKERLEIKE